MDRDATLRALTGWLIDPKSRDLALEEMVDALVGWLEGAGLALCRVQLGFRTLHPEVSARACRWRKGDRARETLFTYGQVSDAEFQKSPIHALVESGRPSLRCSLERPDAEIPFPLCREIKAEGGTDYVILRLPGARGLMCTISFACDRPGGFDAEETALLESLVPALSIRTELAATLYAGDSLLRTYLGQNASRRVQEGVVRRGAGERMRAAIWMCDLRGFTSFVDKAPLEDVIETLDAYFACVADTVMEFGGEVLKFIGDAVLGIFPAGGDPQRACELARRAAEEAFRRRDALGVERQAAGKPPVQFGVALHIGEVMYGNIGATGRLDFTVIGAAVNETARLESLCKELQTSLVLSETFVREGHIADAVSLGPRSLRGVGHLVEVFTLPAYRAAAAAA